MSWLLLFFVLVFYFGFSEASHTIYGMNTRLKAEWERIYEKNDLISETSHTIYRIGTRIKTGREL